MALLAVDNLGVRFAVRGGEIRAVDDVSFAIEPGETVGMVGESGSGKSVCHLAYFGLIPQPPGRVVSGRALFGGRDLLQCSVRELRQVRGDQIAMIFQDPMTSLNPFLTIGRQLTEVLETHRRASRRRALHDSITMLERVGISDAAQRVDHYPHQLSGGMRQRVMIAMALLCRPALLIADEPTTALDVTIQAQILDLLKALQREFQMAMVLISHNLGIVAGSCDHTLVMYAGRIVETASTEQLFARPMHPYTRALLKSVPRIDETRHAQLVPIRDQPPDLAHLPSGCHFHPRCDLAIPRCCQDDPPLLPAEGDGTCAACWVTTAEVVP